MAIEFDFTDPNAPLLARAHGITITVEGVVLPFEVWRDLSRRFADELRAAAPLQENNGQGDNPPSEGAP